jgi:hypothetical protein
LYAGKEIPVNERIVTPREIGDKQFDITAKKVLGVHTITEYINKIAS